MPRNEHPPGFAGGNIMPPAVPGATLSVPEVSVLGIHPLATMLPPMREDEYRALVADIQANGQRQPIVLVDGAVLDGRHRARACVDLGIPCRVATLPARLTPMEYVVSVNLRRRNLSHSQLAMIAARLVTSSPGRQRGATVTQASAAAQVGVSDRYVRDAAWLIENNEALATDVWQGTRALASAVRVARAALAAPFDRTDDNPTIIDPFPATPALEEQPALAATSTPADVMRAAMALIAGDFDYAAWVHSLPVDEARTLLPAADRFFSRAYALADEEGLLA